MKRKKKDKQTATDPLVVASPSPQAIPSSILIPQLAAEHEAVLLAFSGGKDSIAAYLAIREHFKKVVPYFMYLIPDLPLMEEMLTYFEKNLFQGEHIIRLPHPSLYRMLNTGVFQPPERSRVIDDMRLPTFTYLDLRDELLEDLSLPDTTLTAVGVRAVDSPMRWMSIKKWGPVSKSTMRFYPVWDWRKDKVIEEIRKAGIYLPEDYRLFGRSFDGIDLRFLWPLKQHRPADYKRILDWFPLVELEIKRYEYHLEAQKRNARAGNKDKKIVSRKR